MSVDGADPNRPAATPKTPYSPYEDPIRDEREVNGRDVNEGVYPDQPDADGTMRV